MSRPKRDMVRVHLWLTVQMLERVEAVAAAEGETRSQALRRVVSAGLPVVERLRDGHREGGAGLPDRDG